MRRAPLGFALLIAAGCGGQEEDRNLSPGEVAAELADVAIEPGLWESTSAVTGVSAPNLPIEVQRRMIGPRPATRNCITPEQAARPGANFLAARAGSDCLYRDFSMRDGQFRGAMTCPDPSLPRPTQATMEGRYGPRSYRLAMRMETAMPDGATMILDVRGSGRRIGECPAPPAKEGEG